MTFPTVHLNGTSVDELVENNHRAIDALRKALVALLATSPNGRDYYPQGLSVILEATKEYNARVSKVREVLDDLYDIDAHLDVALTLRARAVRRS